MIHPPAPRLDQRLVELNAIFRRLSAAVRGVGDFERFVAGLRHTLEWVSAASGRQLRFEPVEPAGETPADAFARAELHAPVATREGVGGLITVSPPEDGRLFGPEDLHLVGTLAELTGVLLDVSRKLSRQEQGLRLLQQIYDQLPLGVVCFGPAGEPLFSNARARVTLEGAMWTSLSHALGFLGEHAGAEAAATASGKHCFNGRAGAVLAEVCPLDASDAAAGTVIFLAELEARERNLRHALEREVFRSRWLGQPLAFLALETAGDPARLFALLPEIRRGLRATDCCDFLGERQVGIVLPGRERCQALQVARAVCRSLGGDELAVGCAALREAGERAESVLEAALGALAPAGELAPARLLVIDRYRAVPDAVELILRDLFTVEKSTDFAHARARARAVPLDAVMVEHEPEQGLSGVTLLEEVKALQPGVLGVLTTTRHDLPAIPPEFRVVQKPFAVKSLRAVLAPAAAS